MEFLKQASLTPILHSSFYILHFEDSSFQKAYATDPTGNAARHVRSILITMGFFAPPVGIIDASVLTAFGEILTFAGALFGIDAKYKSKIPTDA